MQMVTREVWIHPLNLDRQSKGEFYNLYLDQRHFPDRFFEHYCMTPQQFNEILHKIAPLIKKNDTNFLKAITPEEKLSLTLRKMFCILIKHVERQCKVCQNIYSFPYQSLPLSNYVPSILTIKATQFFQVHIMYRQFVFHVRRKTLNINMNKKYSHS